MKLHGAEIVDTFAEAFPMWGARVVITAATPAWALEAGPLDDRLRDLGDRLQVRGGHRARARPDETPDGRPGVSALLFAMDREGVGKRLVERVGQMRADVPDDGLLQRPGRRGHGRRRRPAALLRRRLPGQQGARRAALLARAGDGGRVPRAGALRRRRGRGRRQHHHARARRTRSALRRGARPRRARCARSRARSCRSPAGSRAAAARSARATARCRRRRTTRCARRCAGRSSTPTCRPTSRPCSRSSSTGSRWSRCARRCAAGSWPPREAGASHVTAGNYGGNLGPHHIHLRELMP